MPGAIPHIAAGLLSAAIVHKKHMRLELSLAILIGNLLPDIIKFGLSALKQGTLAVFNIRQDGFYHLWSQLTYNPANWFSLGFFLLLLAGFLYHYHVIKKKKLWEYEELYVFLLIGIFTHLAMDALIIEKGPWF
ncbi:TPA: hypothetical protein HA231_01075 [Candidatus Woesearchaeota archaeon]|nr:hypothetical protein [Candidatus Woesearchaeota archaeon]